LILASEKKHYLVVSCANCGRFLLAASDKRTRSCPYCEKRLSLEDAKVFARSEDAEEARLALQELKMKKHQGERNPIQK